MKILCVCAGGNTRSVTLATLLKYQWRHDAIAMSVERNGDEAFTLLNAWANRVLTVDDRVHAEYLSRFPDMQPITTLLPIGQDKWGMSMHPDLIPIAYACIEAWIKSPGRKTPAEVIAYGSKYDLRRKAEEAPEAQAQPAPGGETQRSEF